MIKSALPLIGTLILGFVILTPTSPVLADYWRCRWDGTAPFCSGSCRSGERQIRRDSHGLTTHGRGNKCLTGSKALCCRRVVGGTCTTVAKTLPAEPNIRNYPHSTAAACGPGEYFGGAAAVSGAVNTYRVTCCRP
jgi:hypothetical protein